MCNLSFQYSWKSCFCEYKTLTVWISDAECEWRPCCWPMTHIIETTDPPFSNGEEASPCPLSSGQCIYIMNIKCHLVQALDSVSQTGNDMSSRVWMAICHVLSHPANGRITAKPGVMDSSHATFHPADSQQENEQLGIYIFTKYITFIFLLSYR